VAAFDELDFTVFDFDAIIVNGGIAVVETGLRDSCLASLRRQVMGSSRLIFEKGSAPRTRR
jgi:hypothetical protein